MREKRCLSYWRMEQTEMGIEKGKTIRLCSFNSVKGKPRRDVITLCMKTSCKGWEGGQHQGGKLNEEQHWHKNKWTWTLPIRALKHYSHFQHSYCRMGCGIDLMLWLGSGWSRITQGKGWCGCLWQKSLNARVQKVKALLYTSSCMDFSCHSLAWISLV